MGLLDFFRRRGAGAPAGAAAEGPPVGVSDPGSLTGEDADEVVAPDADDDPSPGSERADPQS